MVMLSGSENALAPGFSVLFCQTALAFQPPAVIERVIARGLRRFTRNTIVAPEALREEQDPVRAAVEAEEAPAAAPKPKRPMVCGTPATQSFVRPSSS